MDDKIVKLYIQDQNGERVGFKVKTSAPFQKIANEYCKRKDVQVTSYNFLIDSDRVNLLRTIEELGLDSENEEEVQLFYNMVAMVSMVMIMMKIVKQLH